MTNHCRARLITVLLASASFIHSATLSAPSQIANPGDILSLSLSLSSGGAAISGVQFDLTWNPTLDIHAAAGVQVGISSKVPYTVVLQPYVLRCMIVGMNTSTLADGELIRLFITVNSSAAPGITQLSFTNLTATDPNGNSIPLQAGPISVQIQNGSATQFIQPSGVLNAASLVAGPVSPGEAVTLFGSISAPSPLVLFNGVPAPITYAGLNQVNAIVPFGLDLSNPAQVEIRQGLSSAKISIPVAAAWPAIFTLSATGTGPGAILNQDYSVNSPLNPAAPGSVIMVYGTGFGTLSPLPADGQITQVQATTTSPVTATINEIPAEVLYAGAAPGLVAGIVQINVLLPNGLSADPAAPISLRIGSFTTLAGATVSIQ
jgi:uncharacterized protein (TIGR03437 family)